jgi:hypothetical protein
MPVNGLTGRLARSWISRKFEKDLKRASRPSEDWNPSIVD